MANSKFDMGIKKPDISGKPGSAIVLVLFVAVILLMMGLALLGLGLRGRILAIRYADQMQARCAADAGLTKAVFEMNELLGARTWDPIALQYEFAEGGLPNAADESLPNCEATFSYQVASSGTASYSEYIVTSTGKSTQGVKRVYGTLRVKSLFDSAMLVKETILLASDTIVGGYNSGDPADTDFDVKIGTTATLANSIDLTSTSVVEGDVFVGVDGDPAVVIVPGGTINGAQFALTEDIEFPVITPPPLPDMGTSLYAKDTTLTIGPADSGKYTDITLENATIPGVLEITGGDVVLHITGNIDLGNSCEVVVRSGSSLTIYVDGDVYTSNGTGINNEAGYVKDFTIYATGTDQIFNLKAKGSIFGTIYAPDVDLAVYPKLEIYGALVGRNIEMKSKSHFYYDEALRDVTVYEEGVRFVVERWWEE